MDIGSPRTMKKRKLHLKRLPKDKKCFPRILSLVLSVSFLMLFNEVVVVVVVVKLSPLQVDNNYGKDPGMLLSIWSRLRL